jgi:hypothetical protein
MCFMAWGDIESSSESDSDDEKPYYEELEKAIMFL